MPFRHSVHLSAAGFLLCAGLATPAGAAEVYWTNWTSDTVGVTNGTASGTITTTQGTITVSYSGEVTSETVVNGTSTSGYPSYAPASTYADGSIVEDAPTYHDLIAQNGGAGTGVNTISFSMPISDPVLTIWSLGSGGDNANYTFSGSEPFTIDAGGPSAEYGGGPLVPFNSSDSVTGSEGNGTLQFIGTYSQITFTNTNFENYYGFTVGVDGIAPPSPPSPPPVVPPPTPPVTTVPEPASLGLIALGLAMAGAVRRRV